MTGAVHSAPQPRRDAETSPVEDDVVGFYGVGVDVGSATSHVVFSRIAMEQVGTRFVPVRREVVHQSPVLFTPYAADESSVIDVERLSGFVRDQCAASGIDWDDLEGGAIILTGTALDRRNARLAADLVADAAGRFVAISAGDELEGMLAAQGSGAVGLSAARGGEVLNIDIGGGTTKLTRCRAGRVVATAALDAGARLIAVHDGRVSRLEPGGRLAAAAVGIDLTLGGAATPADLDAIADHLADQIIRAALPQPAAPAVAAATPWRTHPLDPGDERPIVVVTGGVAEYLTAGAPDTDFGDLGSRLAHGVRRRLVAAGVETVQSSSGIRATVLGAAMFTTQLSGSTVHVQPPSALPRRDVPVAAVPSWPGGEPDASFVRHTAVAAATRLGFRGGPLALTVPWTGSATRDRLAAVAEGLAAAVGALPVEPDPLVLVADDDIARLLGRRLSALLPDLALVCLDGIDLRDLDFLDVGAFVGTSGALPVTVKSLVFGQSEPTAR